MGPSNLLHHVLVFTVWRSVIVSVDRVGASVELSGVSMLEDWRGQRRPDGACSAQRSSIVHKSSNVVESLPSVGGAAAVVCRTSQERTRSLDALEEHPSVIAKFCSKTTRPNQPFTSVIAATGHLPRDASDSARKLSSALAMAP